MTVPLEVLVGHVDALVDGRDIRVSLVELGRAPVLPQRLTSHLLEPTDSLSNLFDHATDLLTLEPLRGRRLGDRRRLGLRSMRPRWLPGPGGTIGAWYAGAGRRRVVIRGWMNRRRWSLRRVVASDLLL